MVRCICVPIGTTTGTLSCIQDRCKTCKDHVTYTPDDNRVNPYVLVVNLDALKLFEDGNIVWWTSMYIDGTTRTLAPFCEIEVIRNGDRYRLDSVSYLGSSHYITYVLHENKLWRVDGMKNGGCGVDITPTSDVSKWFPRTLYMDNADDSHAAQCWYYKV